MSIIPLKLEFQVTNQTESLRIIPLLDEFECINDCKGQGDCNKKLQQCICYPGFFGSDCSVSALRLNSGISQTQTIPAGQTAYYYTPYQSIKFLFDLFSHREKQAKMISFHLVLK